MPRMLALVVATAVSVAGCGKSNGLDTAALHKSFMSADAATKESANKAIAAMKAGNLAGALVELETFIPIKDKLTSEQQQAVQQAIAQVQAQIAAGLQQGGPKPPGAPSSLPK
jgi:hypothetical protein